MLFLDTNVFLYAVGRPHPLRDPCRRLIARIGRGELSATTSSEVIQELLFVLDRRAERAAGIRLAGSVMELLPTLMPVGAPELKAALALLEDQEAITVRDAIHAGTALLHGIERIVTADRHFELFAGLRRIHPAEAADLPTEGS